MKVNLIKKSFISIKLLTFLIIANFFLIGSNVELTRLDNDQVFLKEILEKGTGQAMKRSSVNMKKIKDIVGLG